MNRPVLLRFILGIALFTPLAIAAPTNPSSPLISSIEDYNRNLPLWGTTWAPGSGAVNGYYPSFYTGFAMRSEFPERIHVRLARGNQTRVSVVLDDQTITDYLFDLSKRYDFYKTFSSLGTGSKNSPVTLASERNGKVTPQLSFFNQIIESPTYGIKSFVEKAKVGGETPESVYRKSLTVLSQLNPGRVYNLRLDLGAAFQNWQQTAQQSLNGKGDFLSYYRQQPQQVVLALNTMLPGRVNFIQKPSEEILNKLAQTTTLAVQGYNDAFVASALDLFKLATGKKYSFRVLNESNQFVPALQCSSSSRCTLNYPEFTTIYPTGSVMEEDRDQFGNKIPSFSTPGLWNFLLSGQMRNVDNIRSEPYYGWAPKMDYERVGNGFHNPSVRFYGVTKDIKTAFSIPSTHNTLWAPKRGPVSHGCSRLALGHIWEMRQIFPVEDEKMTQVYYFGNNPQDFDVFDVNGDGRPEVMGVEYLISYGLKGTDDVARREGANLEINNDKKLEFYKNLYGEKNVFTTDANGRLSFQNPVTSVQSYLDLRKKKTSTRLTMNGSFPLYEQSYEKDKVQFYVPTASDGTVISTEDSEYKKFVQLLGRIRGCAPTSDKTQCGEAAFTNRFHEVFPNNNL